MASLILLMIFNSRPITSNLDQEVAIQGNLLIRKETPSKERSMISAIKTISKGDIKPNSNIN